VKKLLLLVTCIALSFGATAQAWLEAMNTPNANLRSAQSEFYNYWDGRPEEKSRGIKPFKRWEWFWQTRTLPDGSLPDRSIAWKEWERYQTARPAAQARTQSANWTFRGPATTPSGYWGIGRLNCIAFHPTDPNTFYVGAPAGGLWRTTTGGNNWTPLTDNLPVIGVTDIAIDPANPNTIYIVTGDAFSSDTYSIGVLKSTNAGQSWSTTGLSWNVTDFRLIRRIQIHPTNPQLLWVATSAGIYRSTDGANTWALVQSGSFFDLELKPNDPNTLYAASFSTNSGLFKSTNAGASFTQVTTVTGGRRMNIAVTPANPNLVHVLACNSSGGLHSMWCSTDAGSSYVQYLTANGTNNNMLSSSAGATGTSGQGMYDLALTISPTDANRLFLGGVNTWTSADGGSTWTLRTYWSTSGGGPGVQTVHADKHFQVFHPLTPGVLYECNDGGLYRTNNLGTTWTDLSTGLGISQMYRIGVSQSTTDQVLAGFQDNSTQQLRNGAWSPSRATGDGFESIIHPANAQIMYVSSYYGNISKSTNGGINWQVFTGSSGTGADTRGPWLSPYILHPTGPDTVLVGKYEIYRTRDNGLTFEQLTNFGGTTAITGLAYAPSNPDIIYVARGTNLHKSTDGGLSWGVTHTAPTTISYIAIHPTNPDKVWITQSNYVASSKVRVTTDGGITWTTLNGTLPNLPVNCIVYQNGSNEGLYIGTDIGVYYRNATMTDWVPFQTGLPNVVVTELEITYNNNKLWAATYGRGLWSSDLYSVAACMSLPAAPVSGGNRATCQNTLPVTLTATPPSGSAVDWYTVPSGGTPVQVGSNTYAAPAAGTYYAESRSTAGSCRSTSRTALTVTVNPVPAQPSILVNGSTLSSSAASGNQWFFNGVPIAGATAQSFSAAASGAYTVVVTQNGCSSMASAAVNFIATSVNAPQLDARLQIAPNPVQRQLEVRYTGSPAQFEAALVSFNGSQVLAKRRFTQQVSIDMQPFASGAYIIRVTNLRTGEQVQRTIIRQ